MWKYPVICGKIDDATSMKIPLFGLFGAILGQFGAILPLFGQILAKMSEKERFLGKTRDFCIIYNKSSKYV